MSLHSVSAHSLSAHPPHSPHSPHSTHTLSLVCEHLLTPLSPPLSRASSPLPPLPQLGKKTSSFFGSPFDRNHVVSPSPPPSLRSSQSSSEPRSPSRSPSESQSPSSEPQSPTSSPLRPLRPLPPLPQSASSAFFFAKGSATPTPPPSVHSSADDASTHPRPRPTLPALTRFFPESASSTSSLASPFAFAASPTDLSPDSPTPRHELPVAPLEFVPAAGTIIGDEADAPLQLVRELGQGAFSRVWLATKLAADALPDGLSEPALVAVKMMDRTAYDKHDRKHDRTRVSFAREVEVLRHISHPNIVAFQHAFTTPTHHCLVLDALLGGELFDRLDQADNHALISPPLLRRIFTELARAVAWMHSVHLVHRDLKLENILLTTNPFTPQSPRLPPASTPLIKLTDFGLARFIDPAAPLLRTRCGSESYAAPEIVTGRPYDGRQSDAWACGVVLFALATRALPFDRRAVGSMGGGVGAGTGMGAGTGVGGSVVGDTRRGYLMRIAQGEYTWPEDTITEEEEGEENEGEGAVTRAGTHTHTPSLAPPLISSPPPSPNPAHQAPRLATPSLRAVVARLLVRDPARRARVAELWEEKWMRGVGGVELGGAGGGADGGAGTGANGEGGDGGAGAFGGGKLVGVIPGVAREEL
ncbi:kinase-like protein [Ramaria rubella]|nr:kinase-like protein [Ramaria rubella]